MNVSIPHYTLRSETELDGKSGQWKFVLRAAQGDSATEVSDVEPEIWGERLDLLTVIRALESLDQPSRVTLVSCSRYVEQGIRFGLAEWRENDWRWEYFGQMAPVRDADLWQRLDGLLKYHQVECGLRRLDAAHPALSGPNWGVPNTAAGRIERFLGSSLAACCIVMLAAWCAASVAMASRLWHRIADNRAPAVRAGCNTMMKS